MGVETLIALGIAAAGSGVQAYNTHQTAKAVNREAARGIREQQGRQREINARLNQELSTLERSDPEGSRREAESQFLQALRGTRGAAGGNMTPSTASDRAQADAASGAAAVQNYGKTRAGRMARIEAPARQRQGELRSQVRMGDDVSRTANFARGDEHISQLRMARARERDPWLDALGQVLQAAGMVYGVGAGGAAAGGGGAAASAPTGIASTAPGGFMQNGFGSFGRFVR